MDNRSIPGEKDAAFVSPGLTDKNNKSYDWQTPTELTKKIIRIEDKITDTRKHCV